MPPKHSKHLLPLLAILFLALALVCIAAIFFWMNFGGHEGTGQKGKAEAKEASTQGHHHHQQQQQRSNGEEAERTTTTTTTTMEEEEEEEKKASSSPVHQASPKIGEWPSLHAPNCPQQVGAERIATAQAQCQGEREQQQGGGQQNDGQWANGQQPEEHVRPFEYSFNVSLAIGGQSTSFLAQLSILAQIIGNVPTQLVPLHYGRHLGPISENEVHIWHCQSGTFVCLRSLTRLLDHQIVLLELANPLPPGSLIRLHFSHLSVPFSSPSLLVQIPSPWERDRAWMVGTQLPLAGGARSLFPSVDVPNSRAVFRLCLTHPRDVQARANTMPEREEEREEGASAASSHLVQTCFRESPSLPPAQFAFLLFRQLRPVPPNSNNSKVEMFIGGHLQPGDYGWVMEETEGAMRRMRQLTGMDYPMDRITLVSSPLPSGHDAVGGLGLAQIRDSWVEYPKFVHTHNLLIGQIVRQWTANLLSLCDGCFQRGLALFMEWILATELGPAEDKMAEYRRRLADARQRLMGNEAAAATADFGSQTSPIDHCAERAAFVLNMLDRAFNRTTMATFLAAIFGRHSWATTCTPMTELSQQFAESAGEQHPFAGNVFDSFLLPSLNSTVSAPSSSSSSSSSIPPLIHLRVQPQSSLLLLSQHQFGPNQTANNNNNTNNNQQDQFPWVPIEFVDDTGKSTRLILNQSELALPLVVSSFLIAQPSSFARFTYNVENYQKLVECVIKEEGAKDASKCPPSAVVDRLSLKDALNDLCWFHAPAQTLTLLQQKLSIEKREVNQWRELFNSLAISAPGMVPSACQCCMMPETEALKGHCRWTWLDICSRIQLLELLN